MYGGVQAHADWIRETALLAAQVGDYEAPAWSTGWPTDPDYSLPIGAPCAEPADCPSALCVSDVCTRRCNEAAPCPDGFACAEDEVCEPIEQEEPPVLPPPDDAEDEGCSVKNVPGAAPGWPLGAWLAVALGLAARSRARR